MNFLSLEYFVKVAKSQNISAVAKESYISQQALSERMHKLESEVGTPLFRQMRPLELTPAGERFLQGAQEILAIKDKMESDIRNIVLSKKTALILGIASSLNPPFLSNLINQFVQENPNCTFSLRSARSGSLNSNSDADLFFIDYPNPNFSTAIPLTENDLFAVMVNHNLLEHTYGERLPQVVSKLRATRDLSLLQDLPFVIPCDENRNNYSFISKAFEHAGFQPNIAFRSERHGFNIEMCLNGTGAYLGPSGFCFTSAEMKLKNAECLEMFLVDIPNCTAPKLGLGYAGSKELSSMERRFIDATKQYLHEIEARWMEKM